VWYTIRYANGNYLKQSKNKGDLISFTDDINRAYKYPSIPMLKQANFFDISELKGACIVCVETGEVVEYIRVYNNLLEGAVVLRESDKAIMINGNQWIPKSQCEVINGQIYTSDWMYSKLTIKDEEVV
jgi:hypothetical protein